jgi:hypothetical protein
LFIFSFAILIPREKYLQETWPLIMKTVGTFGVKCELDLREGSMTVRTTKQTWDPFAILQGKGEELAMLCVLVFHWWLLVDLFAFIPVFLVANILSFIPAFILIHSA